MVWLAQWQTGSPPAIALFAICMATQASVLSSCCLFAGYQHFDMIHLGSYLSALSPFWLVAFQTEWAAALFVLMLSLGEAVWSPRWYDYSMAVAPNGREGVFTALASAPLFAAMLPTGAVSR